MPRRTSTVQAPQPTSPGKLGDLFALQMMNSLLSPIADSFNPESADRQRALDLREQELAQQDAANQQAQDLRGQEFDWRKQNALQEQQNWQAQMDAAQHRQSIADQEYARKQRLDELGAKAHDELTNMNAKDTGFRSQLRDISHSYSDAIDQNPELQRLVALRVAQADQMDKDLADIQRKYGDVPVMRDPSNPDRTYWDLGAVANLDRKMAARSSINEARAKGFLGGQEAKNWEDYTQSPDFQYDPNAPAYIASTIAGKMGDEATTAKAAEKAAAAAKLTSDDYKNRRENLDATVKALEVATRSKDPVLIRQATANWQAAQSLFDEHNDEGRKSAADAAAKSAEYGDKLPALIQQAQSSKPEDRAAAKAEFIALAKEHPDRVFDVSKNDLSTLSDAKWDGGLVRTRNGDVIPVDAARAQVSAASKSPGSSPSAGENSAAPEATKAPTDYTPSPDTASEELQSILANSKGKDTVAKPLFFAAAANALGLPQGNLGDSKVPGPKPGEAFSRSPFWQNVFNVLPQEDQNNAFATTVGEYRRTQAEKGYYPDKVLGGAASADSLTPQQITIYKTIADELGIKGVPAKGKSPAVEPWEALYTDARNTHDLNKLDALPPEKQQQIISKIKDSLTAQK